MTVVVFAPDSFKGSIGAAAAARALAAGWAEVRPGDEVVLRPMADGGEGTLAAFATSVAGAERMPVRVTGPAGSPVDAEWLRLPDGTAVVELASTSGIELLDDERRPWNAGTAGFGEAIAAALDAGASALVAGIGSSASTDGGVGLLTALGARVRDAAGAPVAPGLRGLVDAASVDLTGLRPLPAGGVRVLTDVTHPLCGSRGAATVFGPQKGLSPADVEVADAALARWADLVAPQLADRPGAGAAGGAGFGLLAWGAALEPGAEAVASLIGLHDAVTAAAVVVTGEGAFDGQSAAGKAPSVVAEIAQDAGVPVLLAAGRIAPGADTAAFTASASLSALAGSADAALADPRRWLRAAGARLAATVER